MSIFDNYTNLDPSYSPNNKHKRIEEKTRYQKDKPEEDYNVFGEFIGYSWKFGEKVSFDINMNDYIYVEKDAIIYQNHNEQPISYPEPNPTKGDFGQMAYNIADIECWECKTLGQSTYKWKHLDTFTHPKRYGRKILLKNRNNLSGSTVKMSICNFRDETVYEDEYICDENANVLINISDDMAKLLISGVYKFNFKSGDEFVKSISVRIK